MKDLSHLLSLGAVEAAPIVLGCTLRRTFENGQVATGRIVEVEAYRQDDPASHAFVGPNTRNEAMFMKAGTAYVYFTYGMHYCINIVCGDKSSGEALLIRALEPLGGLEIMWLNRYNEQMPKTPPAKQLFNLTNGPAKLTQSLGITKLQDKLDLLSSATSVVQLVAGKQPKKHITQTTRIGISRAIDVPWRWFDADSPFVSKR